MHLLKPNLHHFPETLNYATEAFLNRLHIGKPPEALIIKCSMLNENPELLQKYVATGELLFLQTIGGIVPSYFKEGGLAEKATLEQAIVMYDVKNILICGHFPSRILKELVEQSVIKQEQLSLVPPVWQNFAAPTIELLKTHYNEQPTEAILNIALQEHVLVQIDQLLQYPLIGKKVDAGELKIHGWLYKSESKELLYYNFNERQFIPVPALEPIPKRYSF